MVKIFKIAFIVFLFSLSVLTVEAASLFTSPTSGTFNVGDKVTVKVMVSSDLPINAISGVVSFPPIFLIESISKSSSILNFWVTEPNFSKGAGTLQFEGVSLGGFPSGTGNVVTVVLKANKEGTGNITFKSGQILANDGQGTDLTGNFTGSSFSVKPRVIEPTKPKFEEKEEIDIEIEEDAKEEIKNLPILLPPEISLSVINGEEVVLGSSIYKSSKVLLTFINEDESKVFLLGDTNLEGEFSFNIPKSLKSGLYKVNATIINNDLSYSPISNQILIKVGNIFSDMGIEIKISIILLLLIIISLIIRLIILFRKNKDRKHINKKELKEAEEVVRKSFKILNEDVERDFPKRMTITEQQDKEELKDDLDNAEEVILKEMKDVKK